MINGKWNKVCNSSHGRKLTVIKCNLECAGRKNREGKTGKKLLHSFSNLVIVHPPCTDSTEKFEIVSIYLIWKETSLIFNTLENNVQNHCNFTKFIKTTNKKQSRKVIWQMTHNPTVLKPSLRNFWKLHSHVWQSWIPKSVQVCQHSNIIKVFLN